MVDEHEDNIAAPSTKRKAKHTSKARRPKKPTPTMKSAQAKKTRKPSAAQVAKEKGGKTSGC
ncbi:hypothetical protein PI124_g18228 [Phytophthora idaei]|nr:hypothetical protein PI125_g16410 [Phytophthora idaei]KAG3139547.1 hypothetical protein PI126_g16404 [Phytophthora idaei]KAG3236775.1 hypothetical protein PI124_g18228 [Phytophthora idaei]